MRVATNVAKGAFEVFTTSAAPTEPWLSWTDANERVHLLRSELERPWRPPSPSNPADSLESALENARPLAFVPPETLVAVSESSTASGSSNESQATSRFRLARLICRP